MACTTKHTNPYCSTELEPIAVDVEHERLRIAQLSYRLSCKALQDNGTDIRHQQREATRKAIEDSRARLGAVEMGCAVAEPVWAASDDSEGL